MSRSGSMAVSARHVTSPEVADVHVPVDHDDRLREHHLPGPPDRVHGLAGVAGIALVDRDDHEVVEDALDRQVHVHDLGDRLLHEREKEPLDGLSHEAVLHRRAADDRRQVDGLLAARDRGDVEDREIVVERVEAGVVAERALRAAARPDRRSLRGRSRPRPARAGPRSSRRRAAPPRPGRSRRRGTPRRPGGSGAIAEKRSPDRSRSRRRPPCGGLRSRSRAPARRRPCASASACRSSRGRTPASGTSRRWSCPNRDRS